MSKRRKKRKIAKAKANARSSAFTESGIWQTYRRACELATEGRHVDAGRLYEKAGQGVTDNRLQALIQNDLAVQAVIKGDIEQPRQGFQIALGLDDTCEPARANLALLEADYPRDQQKPADAGHAATVPEKSRADGIRVAILSFLFNWPSTGGGIMHTVELAKFLARASYVVKHFFARHDPWQIGRTDGKLPFASEALEFDEAHWNVAQIQARFRQAVDRFDPDYVLITDCWNFKPLLAEAMRGYPYFLRFQALECLCPLNNVRLLTEAGGRFSQCPLHQLAAPDLCSRCVAERGQFAGSLHQAERSLCGVGTPEYHDKLLTALRDAEAVLVLNPLTEAMLSPYARKVRVVPWGMDAARFPQVERQETANAESRPRLAIFQAGVVDEFMKGFHVLHAACEALWRKRQDFELVATGNPPGRIDAFTRFTGWVSQEELPRCYRQADVVVVPTIAQEGLSRTSVEAMAAGRAVVASRIGGVPYTVADGATGLLCEPGDPGDLAKKIETLLDDADLRLRMGRAGRRRFEEQFTWEGVIERHYRPLLLPRRHPAGTIGGGAGLQGGRLVTSPSEVPVADRIRALAATHPWPNTKPKVAIPDAHHGWLDEGVMEICTKSLSPDTRFVLELGAWLGLSTRFLADRAPNAVVATVDHWQGSPEHWKRPEWRALLPTLYETFLAMCWSYRERIIPLRMTTLEGLQTVASHGLCPDLIYVDAEHRYEAVLAELTLASRLFPSAVLLGDDYVHDPVREAVNDFARPRGLGIDTAGKGWIIVRN